LKFNPSHSMHLFFTEMLKYDSTITIMNNQDEKQLQLNIEAILTNEANFTKYFTVTQDIHPTNTKPHIIIGCHLMSNQTVHEIKFNTTMQNKFVDWLAKEKIFLESDLLGITKTATIGYLLKLHTQITNCTTLKELLANELQNLNLNPDLVVKLDPTLKPKQVEAMSNGDIFIPEPPPFEVFSTCIHYGRDKDKVETFMFGIKCAVEHARLLKEYCTQFSNPMELDTRFSIFLPTGAVHMIGAEAYRKLLCDNNEFLQTITTVPIGDFQHEMLEIPFSCDTNTDIDAKTLYDTMLDQPWCLSVKKTTTQHKVLLVMTKSQVLLARQWTDHTLPDLYQQHIAAQLDVTLLQQLTPRRLDKPLITLAATRYANNLKLCSSYIPANAAASSQFARPPLHRQVKPAGLTYAAATASKSSTTSGTPAATTNTASAQPASQQAATVQPFDYQAEIKCITHDIETKLKAKLEAVIANLQASVEQLEHKFEQKLTSQIESLKSTQADKIHRITTRAI